jgi:hypothetical protein
LRRAPYLGEIAFVSEQIGRIVAALTGAMPIAP